MKPTYREIIGAWLALLSVIALATGCGAPGPKASAPKQVVKDVVIVAQPGAIQPADEKALRASLGELLLKQLPAQSSLKLSATDPAETPSIVVPTLPYDSEEGRAHAYGGSLQPIQTFFSQTNTTLTRARIDIPSLVRSLADRPTPRNLTRVLIHAPALYSASHDLARFDMGRPETVRLPHPESFAMSPAETPFGLQGHTNLEAEVYFVVTDYAKFGSIELEKLRAFWGEYVTASGGRLCYFGSELSLAMSCLGADAKGTPLTMAKLDYGPAAEPLRMVALNEVKPRTSEQPTKVDRVAATATPPTSHSRRDDQDAKPKRVIEIGASKPPQTSKREEATSFRPTMAATPQPKGTNTSEKPTRLLPTRNQSTHPVQQQESQPTPTTHPLIPSPIQTPLIQPNSVTTPPPPSTPSSLASSSNHVKATAATDIDASILTVTAPMGDKAVDITSKGLTHAVAIRWPRTKSPVDLDLVVRVGGTVLSHKRSHKTGFFAMVRDVGRWLIGAPKVKTVIDLKDGSGDWEVIEMSDPCPNDSPVYINVYSGVIEKATSVDIAVIQDGKLKWSGATTLGPCHGNYGADFPTSKQDPKVGPAWVKIRP